MAYGILVTWPGIKPMPPCMKPWNLNHWSTRKSLAYLFYVLLGSAKALFWLNYFSLLILLYAWRHVRGWGENRVKPILILYGFVLVKFKWNIKNMWLLWTSEIYPEDSYLISHMKVLEKKNCLEGTKLINRDKVLKLKYTDGICPPWTDLIFKSFNFVSSLG